jgi:hypothetical protein
MPIVMRECNVTRYFVREEFNPGSPKQLLAYMNARGLRGGYNPKSKTRAPSTDAETLKRLSKKDPLFRYILDWREVEKIDNTYVAPNLQRSDDESRVHPSFLHTPKTQRLSCVNPNWQNIPSEDEDEESLASRFRQCVVAGPGCYLVSLDFASIEPVLTGYYAGDPDYMRLARMGIHSFVLAEWLKKPADLSWDDERLSGYLSAIKEQYKKTKEYAGIKRVVHSDNYGSTVFGMYKRNPDIFPSITSAQKLQDLYHTLCPKLPKWWAGIRERAAKDHYLGGNDHPFHYKHWFWDVIAFDRTGRKIPGADWNSTVAFYPQSTAGGILYETCLRLMDPEHGYFIGEDYFGKTPLRALIHDEILAEVPFKKVDHYLECVTGSAGLPIPELQNLTIHTSVKVGKDWGHMEPLSQARKPGWLEL